MNLLLTPSIQRAILFLPPTDASAAQAAAENNCHIGQRG